MNPSTVVVLENVDAQLIDRARTIAQLERRDFPEWVSELLRHACDSYQKDGPKD